MPVLVAPLDSLSVQHKKVGTSKCADMDCHCVIGKRALTIFVLSDGVDVTQSVSEVNRVRIFAIYPHLRPCPHPPPPPVRHIRSTPAWSEWRESFQLCFSVSLASPR